MTSLLDIWNMALSGIAADSEITDTEEQSLEARLCRLHWPTTRDAVLRAFDWGIARRRADLPLLSAVDGAMFRYRYSVPADFLAVRGVNERFVYSWTPPALQARFELSSELVGDVESTVLLSWETPAVLLYTARVENTALYDPALVKTMAAALGAAICMGVTKSETRTAKAEQVFARLLAETKTQAANERGAQPDATPDWMGVRNGIGDDNWPYVTPYGGLAWP